MIPGVLRRQSGLPLPTGSVPASCPHASGRLLKRFQTYRHKPAYAGLCRVLYGVPVHQPPEIDSRGEEPPYRQVAAWLRDLIESGRLAPGEVLPSEKELTDMTGVGRSTARRAIALLRDEGLVRTVPQRGTYVRDR